MAYCPSELVLLMNMMRGINAHIYTMLFNIYIIYRIYTYMHIYIYIYFHLYTSTGRKFALVEGLSHDLVCAGSNYHVHFAWQVWHGQYSPGFKFKLTGIMLTSC